MIMGAYGLIYGFFASLLCLSFLYLFGLLFFPRFIFKKTDYTVFPFLYGTTLFVLICHLCVKVHMPLSQLFLMLPIFILIMGLFRFRKKVRTNEPLNLMNVIVQQKPALQHWLIAYSILYILAFIFLLPSMSSDYLPIITRANNDIWGYMTQARYLIDMNLQNIVGYDYTTSVWQRWLGGDNYIYALLSVFYGYNFIEATMPLLYACSALIGLMIFRYCQELFYLSFKISISIAAIVICGPFFRYINSNFFLGGLIETIFFIILLTETAKISFLEKNNAENSLFARTFCFSFPCLFLIMFCYNVLFYLDILIQCGLLCLTGFFTLLQFSIKPLHTQQLGFRQNLNQIDELYNAAESSVAEHILKKMGLSIGGILLSAFLIIIFFGIPTYLELLNEHVLATVDWPLQWLSPFLMLGIPKIFHPEIFYAHPPLWKQLFLATSFIILLFSAIFIFFKKNSHKLTLGTWSFFCIPLLAFILYEGYFYYSEGSYEAWKFSSYYVLPFAGLIWAFLIKSFAEKDQALQNKTAIIIASLLVLGNIIQAYRYEPGFYRPSAKYQNLEALKYFDASSLLIEMTDFPSTFLATYYITNKKLSLLSPSYFPMYPLNLEKDSSKQPIFIENENKDDCLKEHGFTIKNLGCLYPSISTLAWGKEYLFQNNRPVFLQISGAEFTNTEPCGTCVLGKKFSLTLYANLGTLAQHSTGSIRFKIKPYLVATSENGQNITTHWGENHSLSFLIKDDAWIHLPYTMSDWHKVSSSSSLSKIIINFEVKNSLDNRVSGINFIALEVS